MGYFQYEIIINVLVSSLCYIRIPMLWVYGHYRDFYSYVQSNRIELKRHNLTSSDVRRLMSIPAL